MTGTRDYRADLDAVASKRADKGYLSFLDHVVVDAQPTKLPFAKIAETWQWERADRIAGALNRLAGVTHNYSGPSWFWNGYHKGSDKTHETARQLCWLLGWSRRRLNIVICAGKEEQAALITKAMRGICADNAWIAERVHVTELKAGGASGSELSVLSMNAYGQQGAFPDMIVAEEVTHWQHDEGHAFWDSFVLATVNKRPHCLLTVSTNAGSKGSWQWEQRNLCASSKFWSFYEAPVGHPLPSWMDAEKIAEISSGMHPGERDRLYKNRWVDPGEEHGYLTLEESLARRDYGLTERFVGENRDYWLVTDYGGVRDRCAMAVMHNPPGTNRAVVDRLDCWQGTHDNRIAIDHDPLRPDERSVEAWLQLVLRNFGGNYGRIAGWVVDPAQLEGLAIKYERRGVPVFRFEYLGGKNNHRLAQLLKTSVQNGNVSWSPTAGLLPAEYTENGRTRRIEDRTLEQELSMLVTKPMSYGYRIDHESGRHDDRSVVIGMGLLHLLPNALPDGQVGPTVVARDPKTDGGFRPYGTVPTGGKRDEWEGNDTRRESTGLVASVGRWGLFGMRSDD